MKILIDADACPVTGIAIECARPYRLEVLLVCDSAHFLEREGARTITVSKGADSADFRLVNLVEPSDIVITQDYGLAAMALAKRARVLNQNGMAYTDSNIDSLLLARYTAQKIRRAGGRLKGPSKRTRDQDEAFRAALCALLAESAAPS